MALSGSSMQQPAALSDAPLKAGEFKVGANTYTAPSNAIASGRQDSFSPDLLGKPYTLNSDGTFNKNVFTGLGQLSYTDGGAPIGYVTKTENQKLWTADKGSALSDLFNSDQFGKLANGQADQGYQMNVGGLTPEQKKALGLEGVDDGYGVKFTDFSKPGWGMQVGKKSSWWQSYGIPVAAFIATVASLGTAAAAAGGAAAGGATAAGEGAALGAGATAAGEGAALGAGAAAAGEGAAFGSAADAALSGYSSAMAGSLGGLGAVPVSAAGADLGAIGASTGAAAGSAASSAGILGTGITTGSTLGDTLAAGAVKGAGMGAVKGGITSAVTGGNILDGALKGAGSGAVSGGVGAGLGTMTGAIPTTGSSIADAAIKSGVSGAVTGSVNAALNGKNIGDAALTGAVGGAVGAGSNALGNSIYGTDTAGKILTGTTTGALSSAANAALKGTDIGNAIISGAVSGGANAAGNAIGAATDSKVLGSLSGQIIKSAGTSISGQPSPGQTKPGASSSSGGMKTYNQDAIRAYASQIDRMLSARGVSATPVQKQQILLAYLKSQKG